MEEISELESECIRLLSPGGRLSTAIEGFVARDAQTKMAIAVAKAISEQQSVMVEAGTGTGKTFAYLLPGLLTEKKLIISTATKTLQDQLCEKDLPMLIRALGLSVRVQNLKGRSNYVCRHRIEQYSREGRFNSKEAMNDLLYIRGKLPRLKQGVKTELPEISESSAAWPYATSTTDNCLGAECEYYQDCFLVSARKRAMEAEVVVINHHLFFADALIRQEGFGEVLPLFDVIVFDEAHQLPDIASRFYGHSLGSRQILDLLNDIVTEWPVIDLAEQPLQDLLRQFPAINEKIQQVLASFDERVAYSKVKTHVDFEQHWASFKAFFADLNQCFVQEDEQWPQGLKRCHERLKELNMLMDKLEHENSLEIIWFERFKHHFVVHITPLDLGPKLAETMGREQCTYVFTSATLTVDNDFKNIKAQLGLPEHLPTLMLPSPFDYQQQAVLYMLRGMPDTASHLYYDAFIDGIYPLINKLKGRCFVLFTSHRALQEVANKLKPKLEYPLLVQGEESKPILLARFKALGNAVLLGTATFWEGVDVKGALLSGVFIDKIPFSSPHDPVNLARANVMKQQGMNVFYQHTLPEAVIALKQGVGRLIRDEEDRGVLVIADPRLTGRDYGRIIFRSLPPMTRTRNVNMVLNFIEEKVVSNECVSA